MRPARVPHASRAESLGPRHPRARHPESPPEPSLHGSDRTRAHALLVAAGLLLLPALPRGGAPPGTSPRPPALPGAARLLWGEPLDPNTAPAAALEALPGVGPVRAAAIVRARRAAPFCAVEELRRVPGIGPVTLRRVGPHLAVAPGGGCRRPATHPGQPLSSRRPERFRPGGAGGT